MIRWKIAIRAKVRISGGFFSGGLDFLYMQMGGMQ
jgi:hypothetical protein